jgi:hypothetical protein
MCEPTLGHQVVGLDMCKILMSNMSSLAEPECSHLNGGLDISAVDADGNAHEHVLGSLGNLAANLEQIGALKSLETKPKHK